MMKKIIQRSLKIASLAIVSFATASAHAKDFSGWYQIEMAIFNQQTYDTAVNERYLDTEMFELNADATELTALFNAHNDEASQANNGFQATNTTLLTEEVRRIKGSSAYQLIWHNSWNQYLTEENVSKTATLHLKDEHQRDALVAQFDIYVKRYLHANIKLADIRYLESVPEVPHSAESIQLATPSTISDTPLTFKEQNLIQEIRTLEEKRRMRSNEIHYFDHPRLGVILKIRRIEDTEE